MVSRISKAWIEAGRVLACDATAQVRCPEKGDGMLTVHDEPIANDPAMLEQCLIRMRAKSAAP